jgi:glucose/arabinose dehydrogenase
MHRSLRGSVVIATSAVILASVGSAAASTSSALPMATNGQQVQLVATGLMTPTSFAFGDGAVFEGDGGDGQKTPNGGLYVLSGGKANEVPTKLVFVGGLQFRDKALYVSGATIGAKGPQFEILVFRGWNGKAFASQKVIYTAPSGFQGFNGLGFGANGRLYVGADVGLLNNNDHGPATTSPYLYDILSVAPTGGPVSVFASGIRQPWQMAFPAGSNSPYVSDFGQDGAAKNPPDFLLRVKAGQNYGFPECNRTVASACADYAEPLKTFAPHTDVGGVAIVGKSLYLSEFGYAAPLHSAEVVSLPLRGSGVPKPLIRDVPKGKAIIGLSASGGYVYFGLVGGKHGVVYRVQV